MAEVAHVLVVLGRTGEGEGVVTADGVADDLDERHLILVVELPEQSGLRVRVAHQRARRRRVETAFLPGLELLRMKGEEVRALTALGVDHLDVLAGLHLVGESGGARDLEVETRLGQRLRQRGLEVLARARAGSRAGCRRPGRRPRPPAPRPAPSPRRRPLRTASNVSSAPAGRLGSEELRGESELVRNDSARWPP